MENSHVTKHRGFDAADAPRRVMLHVPPVRGLGRVLLNGKDLGWNGKTQPLEIQSSCVGRASARAGLQPRLGAEVRDLRRELGPSDGHGSIIVVVAIDAQRAEECTAPGSRLWSRAISPEN